MDYSIDCLYSYVNRRGENVDRYLVTFREDERDKYKNVEFDVEYTKDTSYIRIQNEESDRLTEDERDLLNYILDRWAIQNLD